MDFSEFELYTWIGVLVSYVLPTLICWTFPLLEHENKYDLRERKVLAFFPAINTLIATYILYGCVSKNNFYRAWYLIPAFIPLLLFLL